MQAADAHLRIHCTTGWWTAAIGEINADKCPNLMAQLQISSLPTVWGVHQGRRLGEFQGVPQPQQLQSFLQQLMEAGQHGDGAGDGAGAESLDDLLEHGFTSLESGDMEEAATALRQANKLAIQEIRRQEKASESGEGAAVTTGSGGSVMSSKLNEARAKYAQTLAGLLHVAIHQEDTDEATAIANALEKMLESKDDPRVKKALSEYKLKGRKMSPEDQQALADLKQKVEAEPANLEHRFALAKLQFRTGENEEALEQALFVLKKDKNYEEGAVKAFLIDMFNSLGSDHPLSKKGRSRMSLYLF